MMTSRFQLYNYLILILLNLIVSISFSQNDEKGQISFSGIVYGSEALIKPLGQVSILNSNFGGTSSDADGEFMVKVGPNDTLTFSHVGFHSITITIPDSIKAGSLVAKLFLINDTISLEQVYISSLKDYDNFKSQFLSMDFEPDRELLNAKNNINLSVYEARTFTESTTEDKLEASLQKEAEKSIYFGQIPQDQMVDFIGVAAGLISMIPTLTEKINVYKAFVNLRNQNNLIYIKPKEE